LSTSQLAAVIQVFSEKTGAWGASRVLRTERSKAIETGFAVGLY